MCESYDQLNQDIILVNFILFHNSIIVMVPAAVQQVICNEIKRLQKSSWHKKNQVVFLLSTIL